MDILLSFILIMLVTSLQLSVISRIPMQNGMADIVLLFLIMWSLHSKAKNFYIPALFAGGLMAFISALPMPSILLSYIIAGLLIRFLVVHLWEMPIFSMLIGTILATLVQHIIYILSLQLQGLSIPFLASLQQITLPSIFLNLIFAFPIYLIVHDAQKLVYQAVENE